MIIELMDGCLMNSLAVLNYNNQFPECERNNQDCSFRIF